MAIMKFRNGVDGRSGLWWFIYNVSRGHTDLGDWRVGSLPRIHQDMTVPIHGSASIGHETVRFTPSTGVKNTPHFFFTLRIDPSVRVSMGEPNGTGPVRTVRLRRIYDLGEPTSNRASVGSKHT
jgi:hypothetical protein